MARRPATRPATANHGSGDVLSRKVRPSRTYRMAVADPTEAQAAVTAARTQLRTAHLLKDADRIAAAETAVAEAVDALEACWQPVKLLAIGGRLDELVRQHPPTEEQRDAGAEWNPDTFRPALIAAAAVDLGLAAEQWAAELAGDQWSVGERNELFELALQVNLISADEQYRQAKNPLGALSGLLPG